MFKVIWENRDELDDELKREQNKEVQDMIKIDTIRIKSSFLTKIGRELDQATGIGIT